MAADPGAKLLATPTGFQGLGFWLLLPLWIGFSGCSPSVASGAVVGGSPSVASGAVVGGAPEPPTPPEPPSPPEPPEPPLEEPIGVMDEDAVLEGPAPAEFVAVTENV